MATSKRVSPAQKTKRLAVGRVVGKAKPPSHIPEAVTSVSPTHSPPAADPWVPPASPAAASAAVVKRVPQQAFRAPAVFGALLVVLCITGLVLNFTLPWEARKGMTGKWQNQDRDDLKKAFDDDTPGYFKSLLWWPLFSYISGIVTGILLVVSDVIPLRNAVRRGIQATLLAFVAYASFLLVLNGFRFLGRYLVAIMWPGKVGLHLHIVPYLNLVFGLAFLGGAVWLLWKTLVSLWNQPTRGRLGTAAISVPTWTLAVVCVGLVLLPLLPFVQLKTGSVSLYFGEAHLEAFRDGDANEEKPGNDLAYVRIMMWITFFISLVALAASLLERTGVQSMVWGILNQVYALVVVPLILAVIFTILLYVHIPGIDDGETFSANLSFNYFPILIVLGLMGLYVWYLAKTFLPFVGTVQARMPGPPASPGAP